VSHDPSEIILLLFIILASFLSMLNTFVLLNIFVGTVFFFSRLLSIDHSKEQFIWNLQYYKCLYDHIPINGNHCPCLIKKNDLKGLKIKYYWPQTFWKIGKTTLWELVQYTLKKFSYLWYVHFWYKVCTFWNGTASDSLCALFFLRLLMKCLTFPAF